MNTRTFFELQAELCRAMGHHVRLEIVHTLRDGPKRVGDIAQMMSLAQSIISRHLAVLRNHKIVAAQRQGQDIIYSITNHKLVNVCDLMREVLLEEAAHQSELIQALQGNT